MCDTESWFNRRMEPINDAWLTAVRSEYGHCFGCGLDNPIGLHVDQFTREGDTIEARFVPREEYKGFHDILHGGVIATALDEILAWTAILVAGTMAVTVTMELKYRQPARSTDEYQLRGRLVERRGRRLLLEGTCSAQQVVVAEASSLFLAVDTNDLSPTIQ